MSEVKKVIESGITLTVFTKNLSKWIEDGKIFKSNGDNYKIVNVIKSTQDEKGNCTAFVEAEKIMSL